MSRSQRFMVVDSFLGSLTGPQIMRALRTGWLWLVPYVLLGLGVAWLLQVFLPPTYKATASFTVDSGGVLTGGSSGWARFTNTSYVQLYNSRLSSWYSSEVLMSVLQEYHGKHQTDALEDEEVASWLCETRIELKKHSHLVNVTVSAPTGALAVEWANAYVAAIEKLTAKGVARYQEKMLVNYRERVLARQKTADDLVAEKKGARAMNPLNGLIVERAMTEERVARLTEELNRAIEAEAPLAEFNRQVTEAGDDPKTYGFLTGKTDLEKGIAEALRNAEDAEAACRSSLTAVTGKHPAARTLGRELLLRRRQLKEALARAREASRNELRELRFHIAETRARQHAAEENLHELDARIAAAESGLLHFEDSLNIANKLLEDAVEEENDLQSVLSLAAERILPACPPSEPENPAFPNPIYTYPIAAGVALLAGVVFLVLRAFLADRILGVADIENRIGLKVLAVLPKVAAKERGDVAALLRAEKATPFAEAVSGLRNLLKAPRGQSCRSILFVSTQPGEGKTVTATSLAISLARSGRRTLLADFDLRRPQQAGIWKLTLDEQHSLSHVLAANERTTPDFAAIAQHVDVPNLDVIASLPPENIHPASIFGYASVPAFFAWARVAYECIVVDAPPFGLVGDAVTLARCVDVVVLMCRPDRTQAGVLAYCARQFFEEGVDVAGVVVNDAEVAEGSAFSPTIHRVNDPSFGYADEDEKQDVAERFDTFSDEED